MARAKPRASPPAELESTTGDEALLTALACGATVETAALKAGMSRATAYRRLKEPELCQRLKDLKSEMVSRAATALTAASGEAIKTLMLLLSSPHPSSARLGAARAILELGCRLREGEDLDRRVAELERRFLESDAQLI